MNEPVPQQRIKAEGLSHLCCDLRVMRCERKTSKKEQRHESKDERQSRWTLAGALGEIVSVQRGNCVLDWHYELESEWNLRLAFHHRPLE